MKHKVTALIKEKWEVCYEDEDGISIWKYDMKKNPNGVYQVEQIDKKPQPGKKKSKTRQ
jgi:hypothetical protein